MRRNKGHGIVYAGARSEQELVFDLLRTRVSMAKALAEHIHSTCLPLSYNNQHWLPPLSLKSNLPYVLSQALKLSPIATYIYIYSLREKLIQLRKLSSHRIRTHAYATYICADIHTPAYMYMYTHLHALYTMKEGLDVF